MRIPFFKNYELKTTSIFKTIMRLIFAGFAGIAWFTVIAVLGMAYDSYSPGDNTFKTDVEVFLALAVSSFLYLFLIFHLFFQKKVTPNGNEPDRKSHSLGVINLIGVILLSTALFSLMISFLEDKEVLIHSYAYEVCVDGLKDYEMFSFELNGCKNEFGFFDKMYGLDKKYEAFISPVDIHSVINGDYQGSNLINDRINHLREVFDTYNKVGLFVKISTDVLVFIFVIVFLIIFITFKKKASLKNQSAILSIVGILVCIYVLIYTIVMMPYRYADCIYPEDGSVRYCGLEKQVSRLFETVNLFLLEQDINKPRLTSIKMTPTTVNAGDVITFSWEADDYKNSFVELRLMDKDNTILSDLIPIANSSTKYTWNGVLPNGKESFEGYVYAHVRSSDIINWQQSYYVGYVKLIGVTSHSTPSDR